jgi:hypothetical protein
MGKEVLAMEEHTIQLLKECDSGCKMAVSSMDQIMEFVPEGKLKRIIGGYEEKHRELGNDAAKQLKELGQTGKEPEMMASAFSWMSTEMKMMMKGDEKQAARIMMDGCNMGIKSICGYENQFAGASKESMALAEKLVKTEEAFRDDMKQFV